MLEWREIRLNVMTKDSCVRSSDIDTCLVQLTTHVLAIARSLLLDLKTLIAVKCGDTSGTSQ